MQICGDGKMDDVTWQGAENNFIHTQMKPFITIFWHQGSESHTLYANSLRFHLIKPCRFPFNIRLANRMPLFFHITTTQYRQYQKTWRAFPSPFATALFLFVSFSIFHTIEHDTKTMTTHGNYVTTIPQLAPLKRWKLGAASPQIQLP